MVEQPKLHAVAEVDKDNASRGTTAGQYVVVVGIHGPARQPPPASGEWELDLEFYDDEQHASARATELKDVANGGTQTANFAPPGSINIPDLQKYFANVKRSNLHHFTSKWRDLCEQQTQSNATPEVGKTCRGYVPFQGLSGSIKMFHGDITVQGQCPSNANNFIISFSAEGSSHQKSIEKEVVRDFLRAAGVPPTGNAITPPPKINWPAANHRLDKTDNIWIILSSLPNSATVCADGTLEASEVLQVMSKVNPTLFGAIHFSNPPNQTADDNICDALAHGLSNIKASMEAPAAKTQTWPSSPVSLGDAIKKFLNAPVPPPPSYPLAMALKAKAVDTAAFDAFLSSSYHFTCQPSMHTFAAQQGTDFLLSELESFLAAGGTLSDSNTISNLPSNLSAGNISSKIIAIKTAVDNAAAAAAAQAVANSQASALAAALQANNNGNAPNTTLPQNLNVTVSSEGKDKTTSEIEQRQLSQLRLDAEYVVRTPDAMSLINQLLQLRTMDDDSYFAEKIAEIKDDHIIRLIHSDLDISKALAGGFESVANSVHSLRAVLERRLEAAVLGTRSSASNRSDRLVRALRTARRGNLSRVKLMHLMDEDDAGTAEQPLKSLHQLNRGDAAAKLSASLNRLMTVLCIAFPGKHGDTMFFMQRSIERMHKIIAVDKVSWAAINKYFKVIMGLATKPSSRHALGQGEWRAPDFQEKWLHESSDFHDDLQEARMAAKVNNASNGGGDANPNNKRVRQLEQELERVKKQKLNFNNDKGGDPRDPKTDPNGKKNPKSREFDWAAQDEDIQKDVSGKYLKMPPRGHKLIAEWNKKNPKVDGKFVCWAQSNFKGGCPLAACRQHHKK